MVAIELQKRQKIIDLLERVVAHTNEVPTIILVTSAIVNLQEMWGSDES